MLSLLNSTFGRGEVRRGMLTAATFIATATAVYAQNTLTVKGTVVDAKNEPLIGVNVRVKGGTQGVATDLDGKFTLTGVPRNAILELTYVGMKAQQVAVAGKTSLNIIMIEDSNQLTELVVTGYGGAVQRAKVTNAISKVDTDALKKGVFNNPAQALSGAVAGLRVLQTTGRPGATPTIVVRGGTNFDGSGSPLIVVDGQLRGSMSNINPNDIEDIQVLKDAGATALYGARASNGVVLITTKSGKAGQRSINFKMTHGFGYLNNPYEFLGAKDYITWQRRAYQETPWSNKANLTGAQPMGLGNLGASPQLDSNGNAILPATMVWNLLEKTASTEYLLNRGWSEMVDPIDPNRKLLYRDTNPADFNFRNPSYTEDYNLTMSGGNQLGTYYAGLGYHKEKGLPHSSFYQRYNFTFNGSYKVNDFITASSNFGFNRANWQNLPPMQESEGNYFGRILSLPTTARYTDEDGRTLLGKDAPDGNQGYQTHKFLRDNQTDQFSMVQSLNIEPIKDLSVKLTGNWYYSENIYENFNKDYETSPGVWNRTRATSGEFDRAFSQTYTGVVNYKFDFLKKNHIDVMLGSEYLDNYVRGLKASGSGAPTDDFQDLGLTITEEGKRSIDSHHVRSRILSYFGRANYDYDNKYLFSAVFRYDGYSSLLGANRWGFFPGVSAGWIFGREDFVKEALPFLSFGKLRASYGINGNASGIGAYELQGSYSSVKYGGRPGFVLGTLPNPSLRWEKTRTFDVGLDLSFFNNRLTTGFTFFDRLTSDKYANLTLPSTTGFSSIKNNNGEFRNRGLEFEYQARIIDTKDWKWNVSGNFSYIKNTVVRLPYRKDIPNNRIDGAEVYTGRKVTNEKGVLVDETIFIGGTQEGQEPGILMGYVSEGIFQSEADIPDTYKVTSGNVQGKTQYSPKAYDALSPGDKSKSIRLGAGDLRWKDINGDGIIDEKDQVLFGNTRPRWTGGFNTSASWKGITLSARLDFALGFYIYNHTLPWMLGNAQGTYNATTDVFDTWRPDNPGAKYPKYVYADQLGAANFWRSSNLFLSRGDYLAIRELSLSYELPTNLISRIGAKGIELSITARNLGYITAGHRVGNPEAGGGSVYTHPRTILFGLNINY